MKNIFFYAVVMSAASSVCHADVSADGIGNRMEHCAVVSVTGEWAMTNYPREIDVYYGAHLDPKDSNSGWLGYVTFAYASNNDYYPLDELTLFPVTIVDKGTALYDDTTVTGTTQPIVFNRHLDCAKNTITYTLEYKQGSGVYDCQWIWPVGPEH
jgi:hypothetical protein